MTKTSVVLRVAIVAALIGFALEGRAFARFVPYALQQALSGVQALSVSHTIALQTWAQQGAPAPGKPFFPYERVEAQIVALPKADRDAIVSWIAGNGRGRLYVRGATDQEIGPCKRPIERTPCTAAKPKPQIRELHFALAPGQPEQSGGIVIERGFAAVSHDGKTEVHCLSFKNVAAKTATQVVFGYELLSKDNQPLDSGTNVRTGEFSSNVTIAGPQDYSGYGDSQAGIGHRGLRDNCWTTTTNVARMAALQARYFTIRVDKVTYADGTVWSQN